MPPQFGSASLIHARRFGGFKPLNAYAASSFALFQQPCVSFDLDERA